MHPLFLFKRLPVVLLVFFSSFNSVLAQQPTFVGYYNGSEREIAKELLILSDKRFILSLSYGAVDELIYGTWEQKGNTILLKQNKKDAIPAFTVYGGKGEEVEKGKLFAFRRTDLNTSIAFSFADTLTTDGFKLIHLPGQYMFSKEERLNVISKPVNTFFMAERPKNTTDKDYNVYQFNVDTAVNEIHVYYNPPTKQAPLEITATLKNDELYLKTGEDEKLFGRKELSPYDEKESLDYALKSTQIPDSITTSSGDAFQRIKPVKQFKTALSIDTKTAFFERNEMEETEPTTIDPVMIPEP